MPLFDPRSAGYRFLESFGNGRFAGRDQQLILAFEPGEATRELDLLFVDNRYGNEFLFRSGFARDQHGNVCRSGVDNALDYFEHWLTDSKHPFELIRNVCLQKRDADFFWWGLP